MNNVTKKVQKTNSGMIKTMYIVDGCVKATVTESTRNPEFGWYKRGLDEVMNMHPSDAHALAQSVAQFSQDGE